MAYLYLDESGDLGFGRRSSRFFVCTVLISGDYRLLERIAKKTRKKLHKKYKNLRELHAYHANDSVRNCLLNELALHEDLKIACLIVLKQDVPEFLKKQKNDLYNMIIGSLLIHMCQSDIISIDEALQIMVDRKDTNKYLQNKVEAYLMNSLRNVHKGDIFIQLRNSHEEKSLQVVDFVSWAIFRKYEQSEVHYYNSIKDLISLEEIFPY